VDKCSERETILQPSDIKYLKNTVYMQSYTVRCFRCCNSLQKTKISFTM